VRVRTRSHRVDRTDLTLSARPSSPPPRDEWYKAAFYEFRGSASYFDYVTASNIQTVCAAPGPTPNTANCLNE
jgi:hypothetical protein